MKFTTILKFTSFVLLLIIISIIVIWIIDYYSYNKAADLWQNRELFQQKENNAYFLYFYSEKCESCLVSIKQIQEIFSDESNQIYSIAFENKPKRYNRIQPYAPLRLSRKMFNLYGGTLNKMYYIAADGRILSKKLRDETIGEFFERCNTIRKGLL